MGETAENIALEIIEHLEIAKAKMELIREGSRPQSGVGNSWDARQLSIAITDLESSQLRFMKASPV